MKNSVTALQGANNERQVDFKDYTQCCRTAQVQVCVDICIFFDRLQISAFQQRVSGGTHVFDSVVNGRQVVT